MDFHEIANVWPLMTDDALQELTEDIRKNGLVNPIWLYEGKVLDGRNRWTACIMAGVKPTTKEYIGDNPTAFAVSMNDKRRHMNKGQLGAIAVELLPFFEKDAERRQKESIKQRDELGRAKPVEEKIPQLVKEDRTPQARQEAAKSVGVNDRYVSDAKKVKQEAPEIFEKLKAGKITMQDAKREVAKKPTDDWRKDERDRQSQINSGTTVVANQSNDKNLIAWAEREGHAVRIDRSSKYGNPFVMDQDGDRDFVCDCFENHYLPHKPSIKRDIPRLKGKVLICHCYPNKCHGDTLARMANEQ
jgi:ParB-like chromosome segregation protein Spo0J